MPLSRSKLTSQGQISVPVEVRQRLGIGPGSILEWNKEDDKIVVRRSGTFSSKDIYEAPLSDQTPRAHTIEQLKEGLKRRFLEKHAIR